ncbi:GDP-mannose 4,6-dehydratase [Bacillus andreraoultii]|uniref:GDP-mannose 4,6-dehydratase n=1 Tax=Bacillus andreraoultii TaxID=1499685 RepID=UPI000539DA8E|nr:GDP-mannose 4,6-dehydratase [Bacillus andreraoultii]
MKALVTGGAGFIGSHLVEQLVAFNHEVHVFDNLSVGNIGNVNQTAQLHRYDIRSEEAKRWIQEEKPDVIFHLAAQADVGISIHEPVFDADVNINGTINLLEASRVAGVKKFIFSSTSAVYGDLEKEKINEKDPAIPKSYYGASKLSAELYIHIFSQLYQLPFTILRYGNVYGPRQTAKGEGGVIAVFLEKLKAGQSLNIHGDGEQTRDFIFVKDIVLANLAAVEQGDRGVFNISTGKATSINEIIEKLIDIHGEKVAINYTVERTGDIKHSCLMNEKAKKTLSWSPQVSVLKGLEETYQSVMSCNGGK